MGTSKAIERRSPKGDAVCEHASRVGLPSTNWVAALVSAVAHVYVSYQPFPLNISSQRVIYMYIYSEYVFSFFPQRHFKRSCREFSLFCIFESTVLSGFLLDFDRFR